MYTFVVKPYYLLWDVGSPKPILETREKHPAWYGIRILHRHPSRTTYTASRDRTLGRGFLSGSTRPALAAGVMITSLE